AGHLFALSLTSSFASPRPLTRAGGHLPPRPLPCRTWARRAPYGASQSAPSNSPPLGGIAARRVLSETLLETRRTEPSAITARNSSFSGSPNFGNDLLAEYVTSPGFVHGTASLPSTIRMVLDVPSAKLAGILGWSAPNTPSPRRT